MSHAKLTSGLICYKIIIKHWYGLIPSIRYTFFIKVS